MNPSGPASGFFSAIQNALTSGNAGQGWANVGLFAGDVVNAIPIFSIFLGVIMVFWGIKGFVQVGSRGSQTTYAHCFGLIFGGAAFGVIGSMMSMTTNTIFGPGSTPTGLSMISAGSGNIATQIDGAVSNLTVMLGWLSLSRGIWYWSQAGNPQMGGAGKSPFWRGLTHVFAGGLAANMAGTVGLFASTIL